MPAKRKRQNGYVPRKRARTGVYKRKPAYVMQRSGQEYKFHDVTISDAILANNWTILNSGTLLTIAAGTGESQRVGRKISIRKIGFRYTIALLLGTSSTSTSSSVRVMVYLDKQTNKLTAALGDIVEDDTFYTFNNLSNKGRFVILMDRTHDISSTAGAGDGTTNDFGENIKAFTFFKECNIPIEYNSTAGALSEMTSNNIAIMVFSSENAIARIDGNFRFRFSDN